MLAGTSRNWRSQRRRTSWATSAETSLDQPSAVLKLTTRTGLLYWPVSRSWMTVSRSAVLAPDPAMLTEIVHHQVDVLIRARRHDRRCPIGLTHYRTPRNRD